MKVGNEPNEGEGGSTKWVDMGSFFSVQDSTCLVGDWLDPCVTTYYYLFEANPEVGEVAS
jgi:hypothetical protein